MFKKKKLIKSKKKKSLGTTHEAEEVPTEKFEEFTRAATKWGRAFKENKSLVHIDFSFNQFKFNDMKHMGEALKENHTILGIHLLGNEGYIDQQGFIIPQKV